MARIKKLNERQLINLVKKVIREETPTQGGSEVLSPKDQELSWGKLRQYLKDLYTDYKNKFSDVQPNEFNEVMTILNAVIDLARVKNINNKGADVISQYLKQHVKPLERQYDLAQQEKTPEAPPEPKYGEVNENYGKKSNYNRLYKRLTESSSCDPKARKIRIENCANNMGIWSPCVTVDNEIPEVGKVVQNTSNGWTGVWGTITNVTTATGGPTEDYPEVVSCGDTTEINNSTGNVCTGSCPGWANYDNWCDNFSNLPNMTSSNPNQPCQFLCKRENEWSAEIQNVGPVWATQLQCKLDRVDELIGQYGCANSSASNCQ